MAMVVPEVAGFKVLSPIGEGACGTVYLAQDISDTQQASYVALRTFNALAVNSSLIQSTAGRLDPACYPDGLIPVSCHHSAQGSLCLVMPVLGEIDTDSHHVHPLTLQRFVVRHAADSPATASKASPTEMMPLVETLAEAIASMHRQHIPHGNLKPGNIFVNRNKGILLSDFAMGLMPGISIPPFTDALLYAAPEQLTDPRGYLAGKAYAWDTFAFGAIAFQLLTGALPQCPAMLSKVSPASGENEVTASQQDVIRLNQNQPQISLQSWLKIATDPQEKKRRQIIARCLNIDPQKRYNNLNEVLRAWHEIDTDSTISAEKNELQQKAKLSRYGMIASLGLTAAAIVYCGTLKSQLSDQRLEQQSQTDKLGKKIIGLEQQIQQAGDRVDDAQTAQALAEAGQKEAISREEKTREQLVSLGVANDHMIAWMMRHQSKDLPELQQTGSAREAMVSELRSFLTLTEDNKHFQPIRARIMMQLAEIEIHNHDPAKADALLDKAVAAWSQADIEEPGHLYRIARARLACLIQALDQNQSELATQLLPKARASAQANQTSSKEGHELENQRLKAVMHVIDGRILQSTDPEGALKHFQLALADMQGIHRTLTEHVTVRSDLARYALEASTLAESLDQTQDARKLREQAAEHLQRLLKKQPHLQLAKIQLAKIGIISANSDIRAGNDSAGSSKLDAVDQLLAELPDGDTSPEGCTMQMASAKGLRAVLLRDAGKKKEAKSQLTTAIQLTQQVVEANQGNPTANNEPLYQLAVLNWQLAGIIGDEGNKADELKQGKKAADLMQQLLTQGAGKHDIGMRRALAYLYGDLGHTASSLGQKKEAVDYFDKAAAIWQSLITRAGRQEEYADGLKWSQDRAKEIGH